jgi:hypothetical protein
MVIHPVGWFRERFSTSLESDDCRAKSRGLASNSVTSGAGVRTNGLGQAYEDVSVPPVVVLLCGNEQPITNIDLWHCLWYSYNQ